MLATLTRVLLVLTVLGCISSHARAHDTYVIQGPPPAQPYGPAYNPGYAPYAPLVPYDRPYRPAGSIFGYGYRGMFSGALAGLAVSYFVARHDDREALRTVGLSVGFGALAGSLLGLSLGIFDQVGFASSYYVSRDLSYGVLFGATVGTIAGALAVIGDGEPRDMLFGAATGSLAGLGLGLITGLVEAQFRGPRVGALFGARSKLSLAQLGSDPRGWGARLSGAF